MAFESSMRPRLAGLAAKQGGVVTRRQAVDCGYTERELRTVTGHFGSWSTIRRGVYVERRLWEAASDDARYVLQVRAAALNLRGDAVVSHQSAAALLGLPLRPSGRELVHVTRPGVTGSRTEHGVCHHLAALGKDDVVDLGGLRVTSPARTCLDIGRHAGFESAVVAGDAALREGTTREQLEAALARMQNWPGVTAARAAARVVDGGAQSVGETLTRLLILELDIGVPETQYVVDTGTFRAVVDLRVGAHLFEFDGRVKYVGRERGGVADRPVEEILWEEKRREDQLRSLRLGMSRVVLADLFGRARVRTKGRLWQEFNQTLALYGDLPLWRRGA